MFDMFGMSRRLLHVVVILVLHGLLTDRSPLLIHLVATSISLCKASKAFSKDFFAKYKLPTASYRQSHRSFVSGDTRLVLSEISCKLAQVIYAIGGP